MLLLVPGTWARRSRAEAGPGRTRNKLLYTRTEDENEITPPSYLCLVLAHSTMKSQDLYQWRPGLDQDRVAIDIHPGLELVLGRNLDLARARTGDRF